MKPLSIRKRAQKLLSIRKRAQEKPSKWERYKEPFWFLPKNENKSKGFALPESANIFWNDYQIEQFPSYVTNKSVPLTPNEAMFLIRASNSTGIKNPTNLYSGQGKEIYYLKEFKDNIPVVTLLKQMMGNRKVQKLYGSDIIPDLIIRLGEISPNRKYRYDEKSIQQKTDRFPISIEYAEILLYLIDEIEWKGENPVIQDESGNYFIKQKLGDSYGREIKFSNFLSKAARFLKKFDRFDYYESIFSNLLKKYSLAPKTEEWKLVISAEPADIKMMSTGKGWTSCVEEGCEYYHMLDAAVSTRDMVAYAMNPETGKWYSRVWLRSDGKGNWWPETKVYSTGGSNVSDEDFIHTVKEYLKNKNILGQEGDYHPMASGYSDKLKGFVEWQKQEKEFEKLKEKMKEQQKDPYAQWLEYDDEGKFKSYKTPATQKETSDKFFIWKVFPDIDKINAKNLPEPTVNYYPENEEFIKAAYSIEDILKNMQNDPQFKDKLFTLMVKEKKPEEVGKSAGAWIFIKTTMDVAKSLMQIPYIKSVIQANPGEYNASDDGNFNDIYLIVGPKLSGKTTLLKNIKNKLKDKVSILDLDIFKDNFNVANKILNRFINSQYGPIVIAHDVQMNFDISSKKYFLDTAPERCYRRLSEIDSSFNVKFDILDFINKKNEFLLKGFSANNAYDIEKEIIKNIESPDFILFKPLTSNVLYHYAPK